MNAVVRAWLGFFGLGAGLIHLALVIGSAPVVGIPLLVVGICEFAWGVFAFAASAVPIPRVARIAAAIPLLGWVLLLVSVGAQAVPGIRVLPMLVASLLDLAIAVGITVVLRRRDRDTPLTAGRYLLGVGLGALAVAALTTPALAATEAGDLTSHVVDLPGGHPGH